MKSIFLRNINRIAALCVIGLVFSSCHKKSDQGNNGKQIQWVTSLNLGLQQALEQKKPAFIDFSAEWCVACKEMDESTYKDHQIIEFMNKNFISIKIDNTELTAEKKMILQKYGVVGLPTILFLDVNGKSLKESSFVGYASSKELLENANKALHKLDKSGQCISC